MAQDPNQFTHFLFTIPGDLRRYSIQVSDAVERGFDHAGALVRDSLHSQTWLPEFARPSRPAPPIPIRAKAPLPKSLFGQATAWIYQHGPLSAAVTAFLITGSFLIYQRRRAYTRKRRAKRASNGARKEIVVLMGVPNAPLVRSVILDLERRGFIVYVTCGSSQEEDMVKSLGKVDVLPMHLNPADPADVQNTIQHFQRLLQTPQYANPNALPHTLSLVGLVVIPDTIYPAGPVEAVPLEMWSDSMNSKFLSTVATIQAFLGVIAERQSRVVMLTPCIVKSLAPPFNAVESSMIAALESFSSSLAGELETVGSKLCHIKMGNFNCADNDRNSIQRQAQADVMEWPTLIRTLYATNFLRLGEESRRTGILGAVQSRGGSHVRILHNAVFDSLVNPRASGLQRLGQGSWIYPLIGSVAPIGLVRRLMHVSPVRAVEDAAASRESSDDESISRWEKVEAST